MNVFKKKLTMEEVTEMYKNGRCADLSHNLKSDVILSWDNILTKGEIRGQATVEYCHCQGIHFAQ